MTRQIAAVDYLVLADPPYLRARACTSCGAGYLDRRNACARCGERGFAFKSLARAGRVRAFTEVHRAARSVPTPYLSVIVDLDCGGVVKSNLVGVASPQEVTADLRVELTTFVADTDDNGVEAVAFAFRPEGDR